MEKSHQKEQKNTGKSRQMRIKNYLKEHPLVTDGAMGTYYEKKYTVKSGLAELENLNCPDKIKEIHLDYIRSGARLIRTNTFACNTTFLADIQEVTECVRAGYQIAKEAVEVSGEDVIIAADLGPIPEADFEEKEHILDEYKIICDTFLEQGAECFIFETQSDFYYLKPLTAYLKERADVFIIVQFSCDKSGYTKSGLSMERIIQTAASMEEVDAYGFNCGVEAAHLYQMLKDVTFPNDKYVTALPNAGYPYTLRGKTIYSSNEQYFVEMMEAISGLGINILGGCCGTTPSHIEKIARQLKDLPLVPKKIGKILSDESRGRESEFERKLSLGEKAFIVELDPPFGIDIQKVLDGSKRLKKAGVDLITLADSPMARPRMDAMQLAAAVQRKVGVPVMPHVCCRDKNVIALRSVMLGAYMNEIRHFLIVTGDPIPRESRGHIKGVFDFNSIRLMEYVREMNRDVFMDEPVVYAGALNYHGANPDAIIRRMQQKMENGCSSFLTQPVYSKEDIERLAYIKEHSGAKLICGIMPLVSYRNARFVANEMPGIFVPEEIVNRYREDMSREEAEAVAIEISLELAEELKEIADGYYFMTPFNRASLIAGIIEQIQDRINERQD